MRTEKSLRNIKYSLLGQLIAIIVAFLSRIFFLKFLSVTYLGINGLFTNILTILSFVELGIGPSLTFSLYEPLKNYDREKIKSLMLFFKNCYNIIGIIVFILGTLLVPFLSFFIPDLPSDISNIKLIYWLFVLNSSFSYFVSYKRTLLLSNQKSYINVKIHYSCYLAMNLIQIISLWLSGSFILYLIIQVLFTLIENIIVSSYVSKHYQYLNDKNVNKIDKKTLNIIKKNVGAMVIHKFGSVVVNSTDNLIMSKYVGVFSVGLYSNYYLIINSVQKIIKQVFNSVISSVGDLGAEGDTDKLLKTFKNINFINFIIQSTCSIGLFILLQDFITVWLDKKYLFSMDIVLILVLCFYFTGMRISVLLFKDALGLYWQDRYKAFFEALLNLVISIILVGKLGVVGVFLGTLLSTLLTCFWIEPCVLFKYGLKKNVIFYFISFIKNTLVALLAGLLSYYICTLIRLPLVVGGIIKGCLTLAIIMLVYYLFYHNYDEYQFLKKIILKLLKR